MLSVLVFKTGNMCLFFNAVSSLGVSRGVRPVAVPPGWLCPRCRSGRARCGESRARALQRPARPAGGARERQRRARLCGDPECAGPGSGKGNGLGNGLLGTRVCRTRLRGCYLKTYSLYCCLNGLLKLL